MNVFNSDLKAMTDVQLEGRLRYYLTLQGQRALSNNEALRLNELIAEGSRRHEGV